MIECFDLKCIASVDASPATSDVLEFRYICADGAVRLVMLRRYLRNWRPCHDATVDGVRVASGCVVTARGVEAWEALSEACAIERSDSQRRARTAVYAALGFNG